MMLEDIETTLIKGMSSITTLEPSSIRADVPLYDLGIDSLGLVEFLVFIEKSFNLKLIEMDLTKKDFETIHSIASFIKERLPDKKIE
jgi:acyl carrier protein